MSLLVVGSMAFDSVKTPFGEREDAIGGSATYFSVSASYFTDVRLVAVVGSDFPQGELDFLAERSVDLSGLERSEGKTFRWKGEYGFDLNTAHTLDTQLNVFQDFRPQVPAAFSESEFVFLANIDPELQVSVVEQVKSPQLVACDTMNFWIEGKRDELVRMFGMVDMAVINEGEVRELAGRAREKRLQPDEYTGATFSISNLGMFGIHEFTAVINPPEAGILAVGGVEEVPAVEAGEVVIRNRMKMTMSCDHRVIDGALGAAFLATLKGMLEEPAAILV
mgnify:CR=1 FL=1